MTAIRVERRDRFTSIDRRTINDCQLSWRARGLLIWLLDKPDDWETSLERLAKQGPDGKYVVRDTVEELEHFGYVVRQKNTAPGSNLTTWEWIVRERPTSQPADDFSRSVSRQPQSSTVQSPNDRRTERSETERHIETDLLKTERTLLPSASQAAEEDFSKGEPSKAEERQPEDKGTQEARAGLRGAVLDACGMDPSSVTRSAMGSLNKAISDLSAVGATPEQVQNGAAAFRTRWPNATLTATALAKHWPTLTSGDGVALVAPGERGAVVPTLVTPPEEDETPEPWVFDRSRIDEVRAHLRPTKCSQGEQEPAIGNPLPTNPTLPEARRSVLDESRLPWTVGAGLAGGTHQQRCPKRTEGGQNRGTTL